HDMRGVEAGQRVAPGGDLGECGEGRFRRGPGAGDRQRPDRERGGDGEEDQRGRHQRTLKKTTARTATEPAIAKAYVRRSPVCARAVSSPTSRATMPAPAIVPSISGFSTAPLNSRARATDGL